MESVWLLSKRGRKNLKIHKNGQKNIQVLDETWLVGFANQIEERIKAILKNPQL